MYKQLLIFHPPKSLFINFHCKKISANGTCTYEHMLNGNSHWLTNFGVNNFQHMVLAEFFVITQTTVHLNEHVYSHSDSLYCVSVCTVQFFLILFWLYPVDVSVQSSVAHTIHAMTRYSPDTAKSVAVDLAPLVFLAMHGTTSEEGTAVVLLIMMQQ